MQKNEKIAAPVDELTSFEMIPVVVVESHHHALEHIHQVLRKRRLLNREWSMLHFDSHADLACPNVSAVSCFQPNIAIPLDGKISMDDTSDVSDTEGKNLYESLDSTTTGIAEWILPLVLAANLRHVHWIRPSGTVHLIPSGVHNEYHVGAWLASDDNRERSQNVSTFLDLPISAMVKVDCPFPYYQEDNSCVPNSELILAQPLHLTVSEELQLPNSFHSSEGNGLYMIDICLDYFSCVNPFLRDIELADKAFALAFQRLIIKSKFYNEASTCSMKNDYQPEVLEFRHLLMCLLESFIIGSKNSSLTVNCKISDSLIPFFDTSEVALQLLDDLRDSLLAKKELNEIDFLVGLAVESIPNATMPHKFLTENVEVAVEAMVLSFCRSLEQTNITQPFLITVARSAEDGFTPKDIVDELQDLILQKIHSRYCGCEFGMPRFMGKPNLQPSSSGTCRLQVTFDFGLTDTDSTEHSQLNSIDWLP